MPRASNTLAQRLKSLHQPGHPLLLANVYDILSATAVASLPSCKALATASYSIAAAHGLEDNDLTLEMNVSAARAIGTIAAKHAKPLTVDLQDGYGWRLEDAVQGVIEAGAVGINLEDCDTETKEMYSVEDARRRIERVLKIATEMGLSDFVVNARCDTFVHGGVIDEVIKRGKAYLAAGATTVFVWGGSKRGGISRDEVIRMVKEFDGQLNVSVRLSGDRVLSVKELAEIGVARMSVGPQLQVRAMEWVAREADRILKMGV